MADKQKPCDNEHCEYTLSAKSEQVLCTNCRGANYRWGKRRPAERLERRRKLRLYDTRLDNVIE